MRVLIITNLDNEESQEDIWIAEALKEEGHQVKIEGIPYDEKIEDSCDVILKRNAWLSGNLSLEELYSYEKEKDKVYERLKKKDKILINFNGKFDQQGKQYLVDFFHQGYEVIPAIDRQEDIALLPNVEQYLLKPKQGYDGIGQKKVKREDLHKLDLKDYILQPFLKFQSEVQFYFINRDFQYALEFKPSKIPVYPVATAYFYKPEELALAQKFANSNENFEGIQRIDFIKLEEGKLQLLEIEDDAPYLDLNCLSKEERNRFIHYFIEKIKQIKAKSLFF